MEKKLELYRSPLEIRAEERAKKVIELYAQLKADYPDASVNRRCKTIARELEMSAERVRVIVLNGGEL